MQIKKFAVQLGVFTALIGGIAALLYLFLIGQYYISIFPYLLLFFYSLTIAVHKVLLKAGGDRPAKFSVFYMGSVSLKLFLYVLFMAIYVLVERENAVIFIITFFALYLLYTVFETYFLLKDFNKQQSK